MHHEGSVSAPYYRPDVALPDAKRRERIPLIEGINMRCPRCKKQENVLRFVPMGQIEEFVEDTTPVYKCPHCRWIFAPAPHVLENVIR
jgi:uncharacterized protein with PIN domain